jgi:hypothetical protein
MTNSQKFKIETNPFKIVWILYLPWDLFLQYIVIHTFEIFNQPSGSLAIVLDLDHA